jgi:hypothetical protein
MKRKFSTACMLYMRFDNQLIVNDNNVRRICITRCYSKQRKQVSWLASIETTNAYMCNVSVYADTALQAYKRADAAYMLVHNATLDY